MTPEEQTAREALGVGADASPEAVRRAFRDLARAHHPDRTQHLDRASRARHAARFREVQSAWAVLSGRPGAGGRSAPRPADPEPEPEAGPGLDHERLDASDLDPRPLDGGSPRRWIVLLPMGLLLASVLVFGASVVLAATPLWNAALVLFVLSLASFALAPFFVMLRSGR